MGDNEMSCSQCTKQVYCKGLCQRHYNRQYQGLKLEPAPKSRTFNREELAWAAGLWDGEGSTSFGARTLAGGKVKRYIRMSMAQKADNRQVLDRFHAAIGGLGVVSHPYTTPTGGRCDWRLGSFEGCQAVIALLWHWMSTAKRAQAKGLLLEQI